MSRHQATITREYEGFELLADDIIAQAIKDLWNPGVSLEDKVDAALFLMSEDLQLYIPTLNMTNREFIRWIDRNKKIIEKREQK